MDEHSSSGPQPSSPLRWFPEFWELGRKRLRPQARLLGLSLLVGIVAGVGAIVFFYACQIVVHYSLDLIVGYRPHTPGGEPGLFPDTDHAFRPWLFLVVPAIGGILSGLLVYTVAPEAEGHGTDSAIAAYHHKQGFIRPRVPLVKIISSALTIGTGGSGGREGPIAQIGAGFGSFVGTLLRLKPAERRILMAAGMGAGVAAIFRAPLAGALFAAEVLYWSPDIEPDVIIPAALASIVAYCTYGLAFGWAPLFFLPEDILREFTFNNPWHLITYVLLALCMAILAMLYTRSFYWITHLFKRVPMRPHFKPAIGAFLSAVVGLALYFLLREDELDFRVLSVLSFGYGSLQDAMTVRPAAEGNLYFALVLLAISLGKILTTGLTIGSGGSGGVFGPSMVIGGCGGGALGIALHHVWPGLVPHPGTFVIIGMAGFFAAAAKTPFSTLVIVSEMTGNYNLLLPTLWVCTIAFLLSDGQSIYSSQVESRSRSPAHQGDYVREVLAGLSVRQFLLPDQPVPSIKPGDKLAQVVSQLSESPYPALPVSDADGRLLGVVSLEEVHRAAISPELPSLVLAADLMRSDIVPLQPDDRLDRALELFIESNLLALPVVDSSADGHIIGIVKRADLSGVYLRYVHGTNKSSAAEGNAGTPPA